MITINIYYKGEGDNARLFAKEMQESGIVDRIRQEKGNLRYEYFYPANDSHTVLLIDSWENQEALDIHHKLPLMKEIADLRDKYDLHMEVEKYTSIIDNRDEKFIRK